MGTEYVCSYVLSYATYEFVRECMSLRSSVYMIACVCMYMCVHLHASVCVNAFMVMRVFVCLYAW